MHTTAVAHGQASTLCAAEHERSEPTLGLLASAVARLPDLLLYAHLAQAADEPGGDGRVPEMVREMLLGVCAGTLRLAHRALEVHALTVEFAVSAWVDRGVECAGRQLAAEQPDDGLVLVDAARQAAMALTGAIAATVEDAALVCEQLATGVGQLLATYVITSEL